MGRAGEFRIRPPAGIGPPRGGGSSSDRVGFESDRPTATADADRDWDLVVFVWRKKNKKLAGCRPHPPPPPSGREEERRERGEKVVE